MSEDLSPAEQAYFSSRGADTSGLEAESPTETPQAPASNPPADSSTPDSGTPEGAEPAAGEDDGEEVVIVGKDGKPRATNGRFVPHQALHAERQKRKATEAELQNYREKQARADERLAVLNEILGQSDKPPATAQAEPINPETDPIGALNQALQKVAQLERQLTETSQQQSERENARAMMSAYQQDAVRFVAERPEFKDAYAHLISGRHQELEAMGMSDPAERNKFIAAEERQLVAQAFQSRRSPSQMLYNLAVARGFSAAPKAPEAPAVTQKIEQIAKGQRQAGVSLSSAGGTSGEGLTAAALADMSEEEFAATVNKLGKAKLRQLMGG